MDHNPDRGPMGHSRPDEHEPEPEPEPIDRPAAAAPKRTTKRARTDGFDSDEALSTKTRYRVTRACNECRKRKDRCDGQRPSCASCLAAHRSCCYDPSKKRGLRTGYVRALEILIGLVMSTIEGSDEWLMGLLEGQLKTPTPTFRTIAPTFDTSGGDASEFLLDAWRGGTLCKRVEQLLSGEDEGTTDPASGFESRVSRALALTATESSEGDSFPLDSSSGALLSPMNTDAASIIALPMDLGAAVQLKLQPEPPPPPPLPPSSSIFPPAQPVRPEFHQAVNRTPMNIDDHTSSVMPSPLPEHWPYLLDLYFATTHPWFPISQKHELLRTACIVTNATDLTHPPDGVSNGDIAFLYAALAYSSRLASSIPSSPASTQDIRDIHHAESLASRIDRLCAEAKEDYELGHVQAFLLLALLQADREAWLPAWMSVGRAVYATRILRLNTLSPLSYNDNSPVEEGLRRTLLGCFVLETLIAARLDVKPCLSASDFAWAGGSLQTDVLEEWEPWQPKIHLGSRMSDNNNNASISSFKTPGHVVSNFNRLGELMRLVNNMLHRRPESMAQGEMQALLGACEQKLSALNSQKCSVDMAPQLFNLHVTAVALHGVLSVGWKLAQRHYPSTAEACWNKMHYLGNLLEQRIEILGVVSLAPPVRIFLHVFHRSLSNPELHDTAAYYGDRDRTLLNRLETWQNALKAPVLPTHDEQQDQSMTAHDAMDATSNITNVDSVAQRASQEMISNHLHPSSTSLCQTVQHQDSLNAEAAHAIHNPIVNSLPESYSEDMEDDSLFNSLASLDSAEWLTNYPDFMKHLGVLGDAPTSLDGLFNADT